MVGMTYKNVRLSNKLHDKIGTIKQQIENQLGVKVTKEYVILYLLEKFEDESVKK